MSGEVPPVDEPATDDVLERARRYASAHPDAAPILEDLMVVTIRWRALAMNLLHRVVRTHGTRGLS